MVQLNLTEVFDQEAFEKAGRRFDPVPRGKYRVHIYEINAEEVKTGEYAGKTQLAFQFRIPEGTEAHDGTNVGKRVLFSRVNTYKVQAKSGKNKGQWFPPFDYLAIGKAIGLNEEQIKNFNSDEWLGGELEVEVGWEQKMAKSALTNKYDVPMKDADGNPEYREVIKSYRSLKAASTAATADAKAAKAGANKASKYTL